MRILTRVFAFIGSLCPFCIVARKFPESKYAGVMRKLGRICPFCIAYQKLKRK